MGHDGFEPSPRRLRAASSSSELMPLTTFTVNLTMTIGAENNALFYFFPDFMSCYT